MRLTVDSRPGESFPGTVARVASFVLDLVEQNRTVEVEADFSDPVGAASVLPGTSADVEVILSSRDGVLRIPTSAIAEGGAVLVLERGRLAERTVTVGPAQLALYRGGRRPARGRAGGGDGGGDAFEIGEGQCPFDIGLREAFELGLGDHGVPAE